MSLAALRLFERKGFEPVTMDQIAEAAGVSRRTLFRLFPSKADLVWEGLEQVVLAVRALGETLSERKRTLGQLVEEVFAVPLRQLDDPEFADVARRRLRLIGSSPELLGHQTLRDLQAEITQLVAAHAPASAPPAQLVAEALVAVGFSSTLWWARDGATQGLSALDALRAALRTVALASVKEG